MQTPPLPHATPERRVPPVLLVKAEANHVAAVLPLFEDKVRMLKYGKWAGIAFVSLLVLSALFSEGDSSGDTSTAAPSNYGGSYEDRMNAGIAELGGTYDSNTGTMSTNR
jgi:hypothetical protein